MSKGLMISYCPDLTDPSVTRIDVLKVDPPVHIYPSCYRLVGTLPILKGDTLTGRIWKDLPDTIRALWAEGGKQAVLDAFPDRGTFVAREVDRKGDREGDHR